MILNVAVIGSGFGGLGTAIRLKDAGIGNFALFERADDLGGTWRDNTYPGCRCDVASDLYSFSFEPNPLWSNTYSYQPEIWAYLQDVATKHELRELIKFNHDVTDVSYDPAAKLWNLATNTGTFQSRNVVLAAGGLAEPRMPDIEGIENFDGPVMHTARWDEKVSLVGKRVGVIGNGASAIQTVPQIAPLVGALEVFQRTPSWILPHLGHEVSARSKRLFSVVPLAQRMVRSLGYWRRELTVFGFVKDPSRMTKAETMAREHLGRQVQGADLRERMTPNYRLGCKRVMISNDYYPAFSRENVTLVTEPIERIEPKGIRTVDGVLHEFDVIIAATGFYVTDNPIGEKVHGAKGEKLAEAFCGDMANYKGTMFPDFPNLFMLGGPNTALGHSSIIFMHESQLNYIVEAIEVALKRDARLEPSLQAARKWTEGLQAKLPGTVWGTGCSSWYLNDEGKNTTIWPDFTFKFRKETRHFVPQDHEISA
jgi:cation diffusion facilitator CzcD-associated flavoprotein CzcO